jgi:HK97 family phage major capsid protein
VNYWLRFQGHVNPGGAVLGDPRVFGRVFLTVLGIGLLIAVATGLISHEHGLAILGAGPLVSLAELKGLDAHKAARDQMKARLKEIDDEFEGKPLSEEARAEFEAIAAPATAATPGLLSQLDAVIAELEVRANTIEAATRDTNSRSAERSQFNVPNVVKIPDNIFDLSAYRQRANSIDDLPGLYRDGAMRVIEKAQFPSVRNADKARDQVAQLLAEHANDAPSEGRPAGWMGRHIIGTGDPQYQAALAEYVARGRDGMAPSRLAVLQTYSDPDGGFGVPFTIDPTFIITTDGAASSLREFARVETITSKSWHPLTTEDGDASYVGETDPTVDSAPNDIDDLNGVTPVLATRFIKYTATYQEDYGASQILGQVGKLISDSKSRLESVKFVQGDGSGEPEGIIWKLDDDGTSLVSVASFDLDALDALTAALGPRFRETADGDTAYMANIAILQKMRQLGTAGAPANSIYDQISKTLNGYPARELSAMDDVWTTGKEVLLFGDFEYFVIVDRIGLSVEYVPQVFNGDGNPLGQRGVYARWRNTSKVITVNAFRLLTHS